MVNSYNRPIRSVREGIQKGPINATVKKNIKAKAENNNLTMLC
jgi:hypothetical protein